MFDPKDINDLRTLLRTHIEKAGMDDPEALAQIVTVLDDALAVYVPHAVQSLRDPDSHGMPGYTWTDLSAAFGWSRNAAGERWRKNVTRAPHPGRRSLSKRTTV